MEKKNTNPLPIAESKREHDKETVFQAADIASTIYNTMLGIAVQYGFPEGEVSEMRTAFDAVSLALSRLASFIINPAAPTIPDAVRERISCGID